MNTLERISQSKRTISRPLDWETPPAVRSIDPCHIHIWKVDLKRTGISREIPPSLSADERERAARLVDPTKRERFLSARLAMRDILSGYTHIFPEKIRFSYQKNGKPFIENNATIPSISFNITHSTDLMLVAVSEGIQIGIDIEKVQPLSARDRIIRQYFSILDDKYYQSLPDDEKRRAFFSLWTSKEAYAKTLGTGFAASPDFDFFKNGFFQQVSGGQVILSPRENIWFLSFEPKEGYLSSAVVLSGESPTPLFYLYEQ